MQDKEFKAIKDKAVETLAEVKSVYRPQRKYKRHDAESLLEEEARVHSTLLEYGRKYTSSDRGLSKSEASEEMSSKKSAVESSLSQQEEDDEVCRAYNELMKD